MDTLIVIVAVVIVGGLMLSPFLAIFYLSRRKRAPPAPQTVPVTLGTAAPVKTSNGISPYFLALVAVGGLIFWWVSQPRFSEEDVKQISAQIKSKFEERPGVHALEVSLARENANKLVGFVHLKIDGLDGETTKDCTVTRDSEQTIWVCR